MIRTFIKHALAAVVMLAPTFAEAGTYPSPIFSTVTLTTGVVLPDGTNITCGGSGSGCVALGPALTAEAATARAAEQANAAAISAEVTRATGAEGTNTAAIVAEATTARNAANLTAGTVPSARLPALSAQIDAAFGSTQGGLVYRSSTGWMLLAPGTAGQVLGTGGAGANPAWTSTSQGTVTSAAVVVPPDESVSGSPITSSGTITIARSAQAANTLLAGPASGSSVAPSYRTLVPADIPATLPDGCIRMVATSSTVLTINPYGCSTLVIGGVPRVVSQHTCSISSPSASTLYYVYEAWSGTAVTCSYSTTGHITGSDGREYLSSGGSTPTAVTTSRLAGMVYTTSSTSAPLSDVPAFRGVANFFNRQGKQVYASNGGAQTTSSAYIEYVQVRTVALVWADETATAAISGVASNSTANAVCYGTFWANGTSGGPVVDPQTPTAGADNNMANSYSIAATEGVVVLSPAVKTNAGTMTITMSLMYSDRI